MRIGVIADSHVPSKLLRLPLKVERLFHGVEEIWHAGDIEDPAVLEELSHWAPVRAIAGNMDGVRPGLPRKRSWVCEGIQVGMKHGDGLARHLIREQLHKVFPQAGLIVYGHTHEAFWGEEHGVHFLNPGSAAGSEGSGSIALLELTAKLVRGEICRW